MTTFLDAPGFFGTRATVRSDLTLTLTLVTAGLFIIGWHLAVRKHFEAHRWVQTIATALNTGVVLVSMVSSFVLYILPGLPAKLYEGSYGITTLHALVGALGLVLGVFVTLRGNELVPQGLRFRNYKLFMRITFALYMASTLGGVILYVIVFVYGI